MHWQGSCPRSERAVSTRRVAGRHQSVPTSSWGWSRSLRQAVTDVKVADTCGKTSHDALMVRTSPGCKPRLTPSQTAEGYEHEIEDIDVVETERRGVRHRAAVRLWRRQRHRQRGHGRRIEPCRSARLANALRVSVASDDSSSAGSTVLAQAQYTFSATVSAGPDAGQTISGTLMLKTEQEDDGNRGRGPAGADHRGGDDDHHQRGDRRPG